MSLMPQVYDGRKCFMPCPPGPCHCRDAVRQNDERTNGSEQPQFTDHPKPQEDDNDFPLGTACDRTDPDCEACQ